MTDAALIPRSTSHFCFRISIFAHAARVAAKRLTPHPHTHACYPLGSTPPPTTAAFPHHRLNLPPTPPTYRLPAAQSTGTAARTHAHPLRIILRCTPSAFELTTVEPPDTVTLLPAVTVIAPPPCREAREHT